MGAKHWAIGILVVLLAVVVKAHVIFMRLVVLAAAGLAGLFLLHILAQDYRKIQSNRPKAFGLFKRSIEDVPLHTLNIDSKYSEAHRHLEQLQNIQHLEGNSISLIGAAAKLDPQGCAKRYICSLAAGSPKSHTSIERALLELITSHKDATEFQKAVFLGRKYRSSAQCVLRYSRCTYSITEMLTLVQPVY